MTCQFPVGVFIAFLTVAVVYTAAKSPRRKFSYTIHMAKANWSEALAECEGRNGTLLQLNTAEKLEDFNYAPRSWKLWEAWIGAFDRSPPDMNYIWTGCTIAEQSANWPWWPQEPNRLDTSPCLRVHRLKWLTTPCNISYNFICEKSEGNCTFMMLNNVTLTGNANVSLAGAMTLSECGDLCISYYADEKECVAFTHDKESDQCMLLLQRDIYISESPQTRSDHGSITAVKKCYNFYTSEEPLKYLVDVKNLSCICANSSDDQNTTCESHVRITSSLVPTQSSDWQPLSPSPSPVAEITLMAEDANTMSGILQPSTWELQPSSTLMHQNEPATPPSQTTHHYVSPDSLLPTQTHAQYNANTLHRAETTGPVLQTQAPNSTRTCQCRCTVFQTGNTRAPVIDLTKLQMDRQKVSRYRRHLTSAADDRPSARVVGSVLGVAVLVTVGVLIILMDVAVVLKHMLKHLSERWRTSIP